MSKLSKYRRLNQSPSKGEVFTPPELVQEMLSKLPVEIFISTTTTFLIPSVREGTFIVEVVKKLIKHGHSKENALLRVIGTDRRSKYVNPLKRKGYRVYKEDFLNPSKELKNIMSKKFDAVIMNPPYTQGAKLLYTYFTEKALELSDCVLTVMPLKLESNHDKLKFHNQRIHRHSILISDNVSSYFNVNLNNIHYMILDKNLNNPIPEKENPLDDIDDLYPDRDRINFIKGDTDVGQAPVDEDGVNTIYKVYKDDEIIWRKVSSDIYEKSNKKSDSEYLVVVNGTPSMGKFNCVILKNTNPSYTWSIWTYVVECHSLKDAERTKKWLQSDIIKNEVYKILKAKNTHSISLEMLSKLPTYD